MSIKSEKNIRIIGKTKPIKGSALPTTQFLAWHAHRNGSMGKYGVISFVTHGQHTSNTRNFIFSAATTFAFSYSRARRGTKGSGNKSGKNPVLLCGKHVDVGSPH